MTLPGPSARGFDLLLLLPVLSGLLALRAVRRGEQRRHGHLMAVAVTLVALIALLHPADVPAHTPTAGWSWLALAASTMLLGRWALAWREGRSRWRHAPQLHRAAGMTTLLSFALLLVLWLLRAWT